MDKQDKPIDLDELLAAERLVVMVQSLIQRELNKRGMKYRDLARRLGVSEGRISQLMGDNALNLTVKTLGRILHRLDEAAVILTEKEHRALVDGTGSPEAASWVFRASGGDFTSQERTEIVVAEQTVRPSDPSWKEWAVAEDRAQEMRAA